VATQPSAEHINRQTFSLPSALDGSVRAVIDDWQRGDKVRRLWQRDATLWTGRDEANWLGWLDLADSLLGEKAQFAEAAQDARQAGFTHALLLGMGGSSLCPEVLAETFGAQPGYPRLRVLDSTDPAQVRAVESQISMARTLFIVASKSGTTLEPNIFMQYFFDRARQVVGADRAGSYFLAITDPGSKLHHAAESNSFRRIHFGVASVGGRYSALSNFGMLPAAVMGLDVPRFLERARDMARACGPDVPPGQNPGVVLGAILGALARDGRDKMTIIASPEISDLGAWLEQLVAESTGKDGRAIIPVDLEPAGPPDVYGNDRVFVYLRNPRKTDNAQELAVDSLQQAGQPVIRIHVSDAYSLGQEFFRWEFATAVAGSVLGIHPFDQPDVEASKIETRKLTSAFEETGSLPEETPFAAEGPLRLFTDAANAAALRQATRSMTLESLLRAHLKRLAPGDYFAILAYLERNDENRAALQRMRLAVRDARGVATSLGFGPRFLHSTGQAYKGGPNSGVFLQITCDDAADLAVPGQKYTFGVVKAAQARGDFDVLAARGRRALRVHLGGDVRAGLKALAAALVAAVSS
jgi:transaldolase/glucose-6-phosphate isomerase